MLLDMAAMDLQICCEGLIRCESVSFLEDGADAVRYSGDLNGLSLEEDHGDSHMRVKVW